MCEIDILVYILGRPYTLSFIMHILGIDTGDKESSVALVAGGRLVAAACEERFSRIRFDRSFPHRALDAVLAGANLSLDDIDAVAGNISEAQVRAARGLAPRASRRFPTLAAGPAAHGLHHLSHAAFALYTSGWPTALVITIDNHGDNDTLVVFRGDDSGLHRIGSIDWRPVAIGGVYEEATRLLGFGEGGEGKLMGLAGYGTPQPEQVAALLRRTGRWAVESEFLTAAGHDLRALARPPWQPIRFPEHADFAASVQASFERTLAGFVTDAIAETGVSRVCLAGGVALNCSLNGALLRHPDVQAVWVAPSPADPGNAAGAALLWAAREGGVATQRLLDGGLGVRNERATIELALRDAGQLQSRDFGPADSDAAAVAAADDVAQGRLVGFFEGRSEFGPRALGHRSIIADPRSEAVRDRLNDAKLRERWRPLAPSILREAVGDWLVEDVASPFMLFALTATERLRNEAPAAVHVDGSARAQTVTAVQPAYRKLIAAFAERTGVPLVLNTSFNQAGEPIVESAHDAIDCARRAGLDVLWLDGVRVELPPNVEVVDTRTRRRVIELSGPADGAWPELLARQRHFAVRTDDGTGVGPDVPLMCVGAPEEQAAELGNNDRAVATIGPLSAWDADTDAGEAHETSYAIASEGLAAVRRNLCAERIGRAHTIEIAVPENAGLFADPSVFWSRARSGWHRLAQGLAVALWLSDEELTEVACVGETFADLTLTAAARDGSVTAHVSIGGPGPLPDVRCVAGRGEVRLGQDGTLTLQVLRRGTTHQRRVDTSRDPAQVFADIDNQLESGGSERPGQLLSRAGTRVDEALESWARGRFATASWAADDREKAAANSARELPWTLHRVPNERGSER